MFTYLVTSMFTFMPISLLACTISEFSWYLYPHPTNQHIEVPDTDHSIQALPDGTKNHTHTKVQKWGHEHKKLCILVRFKR